MDNGILLESGTGELEILEFIVNNKHYAINVIKVKEVIDIDSVTKLPQTHPAIAGLILCRNEIITLVDLNYVLDGIRKDFNKSKIIICEFNKIKVAFNIDDIVGVHRIKWEKIMKPDDLSENSLVIGNILLNEQIILLLDFEKIVTDISPSTGISEDKIVQVDYKDRSNIKVMLADDSALIRRLLKDTLTKAGFNKLNIFDDGKQALDYLENVFERKQDRFTEDVQILITDIEMPQMDGHTLTRKIKEHPILRKLPVIIFSSLITDNLRHKGESVGADAQLSKPEVGDLVNLIDKYVSNL
ncbi:two-component system chemotaxis response regulator CheV [Clostridium tetanomorphum]|uniref:Stage 0 sporulation protein A homolog n=1 Tax=Clostridium tetanomorphum TaxID=1553 RepID=A0A923EET9_CLOTT|nr:chemotaxis protein [Clostridium tetanomorphum]KAJ50525.1 putative CheW protein [Clostridium tetanomorphum DSM 665]MBC2399875.1 chemotaxis protein CheV [Clostridium tetanomorphum]MBP1866348.1 two-component system chemotaxis response regulator CheV [Clostridium tetanomorphum]NRS83242.1 two-component system chemotaxis response regulator CheV [Clostridium tetanomorphum]NRZ98658.1 two-component system chemotaxis response regulator CheV [Clostridium tetanomorphum]